MGRTIFILLSTSPGASKPSPPQRLYDSGASHSLMTLAVMEKLGLDITEPYKYFDSFDSKRVQFLGIRKDLIVGMIYIFQESLWWWMWLLYMFPPLMVCCYIDIGLGGLLWVAVFSLSYHMPLYVFLEVIHVAYIENPKWLMLLVTLNILFTSLPTA